MKKRTFLSLALMMFAAWHVNEGMRGVAQERSTTAAPYTVTDIAGREIAFDKVPERVLALGHGCCSSTRMSAGPTGWLESKRRPKADTA